MLFTVIEIVQLLVASLVISYIFTSFISVRRSGDVLDQYGKRFDSEKFKWAAAVGVPSVILHELGHKFVAQALGLVAHFEMWTTGLVLGVVLKLLNFGFMILAPGYVSISGLVSPLQSFLTAFSGPLVNLALWVGALLVLKYVPSLSGKKVQYFSLLAMINKWLFLFNMIPIPPLDGSKVLFGLLGMF